MSTKITDSIPIFFPNSIQKIKETETYIRKGGEFYIEIYDEIHSDIFYLKLRCNPDNRVVYLENLGNNTPPNNFTEWKVELTSTIYISIIALMCSGKISFQV